MERKNIKHWLLKHHENSGFGDRMADHVAQGMGSWTFIIWQTVIVAIWIGMNVVGFAFHWDIYPFILLNLLFSTQAAYAAPIIMMSNNRQSDRDRAKAEHDYAVNEAAKEEIEQLIAKITSLEQNKLDKILEILSGTKARKPKRGKR